MLFDEEKVKPDKIDDIKGEEKEEKKELKPTILSGPYKTKVEVTKRGNFRIEGKVYDMLPGSIFDGSKIDPRKMEILINTKYIKKV